MMQVSGADVPQASTVATLFAAAQHVADGIGRGLSSAAACVGVLPPYRSALRILGALDGLGEATPVLVELASTPNVARDAFCRAFAASRVGSAWCAFAGVEDIQALDPESAEDFLMTMAGNLGPLTIEKRAGCLKSWCTYLQAPVHRGVPEGFPASRLWPSATRFPHNQSDKQVRDVLLPDLSVGPVLMVVGYTALKELIPFLGNREPGEPGDVRILFGMEPFRYSKGLREPTDVTLEMELRKHWLERNVSIILSADILKVRNLFENRTVLVRLAPNNAFVHSKIYVSRVAATLGSSNFTSNGLGGQAEANARFEEDRLRFWETWDFAEGFWNLGYDYNTKLVELLDELLQPVTWEEALARACAELLEGRWAAPDVDLPKDMPFHLWTHQIQALAQALWILDTHGSVLVADPTGSGKTLTGAWILAAASGRLRRLGHQRWREPIIIAPAGAKGQWEADLHRSGVRIQVESQGLLSHPRSQRHELVTEAVMQTGLLAIDEAHNFINDSGRTQQVVRHLAENVVLFTATPINKGPTDLLGLVDLLGIDNFSDGTVDILSKLQYLPRTTDPVELKRRLAPIREELQKFMIRRTRAQLNACSEGDPGSYILENGRRAHYPKQRSEYYRVEMTPHDLELGAQILDLIRQLRGIGRFRKPLALAGDGTMQVESEAHFFQRLVRGQAALAQHLLLDCLRSSRPAAFELIYGTKVAKDSFPTAWRSKKDESDGIVQILKAIAGRPPKWAFHELGRSEDYAWLWKKKAHQAACEKELAIYERIGELILMLSPRRELSKIELLQRMLDNHGRVLAFDSHVLSVEYLGALLRQEGVNVETFIGQEGGQAKRRLVQSFGLHATGDGQIAICSDALSESLNLQGASVIVHLNLPTVVRVLEQREGRINRINSPFVGGGQEPRKSGENRRWPSNRYASAWLSPCRTRLSLG